MATEITMPKLSDTMTEGRLVSWKKGIGEEVRRGDIIAEVETDKANMELEAFTAGVLLETRVKPGEMVAVGSVIAFVGEAGETVTAPQKEAAAPSPEPEEPAPQAAGPAAAKSGVGQRAEEKKEELPVKEEEKVQAAAGKASPIVRRLARERGIDLKLVTGSGPDGRILREDLEKLVQAQEKQAQAQEKQAQAQVEVQEETKPVPEPQPEPGSLPLTRMRAAIARTVSRAWQEIPHFAVTTAIDMGEAEELRRELKESGKPFSINDLIVKAAALALQKFPQVNNSFAADRIKVNKEINIGIVVALEDGLLVPVIKGCGALNLGEIALRGRELIDRAKGKKISENELAGGTFTLSNLGMFGVDEFIAVIQPPQGAILAVGAIKDEAAVKNGRLVIARIMRATLSADHRLIDGAYAAQFLQALKKVLESPATMLV